MSFYKAVATPLQSSTLHRQARRGERHQFDRAGPAAGGPAVVRQFFKTFTTWISVNPSRPHGPFSTPMPDHFAPPNGRFGAIARC